jgi:hypothetical protein
VQQGAIGEEAASADGALHERSAIFGDEGTALDRVQASDGLRHGGVVEATEDGEGYRHIPATVLSLAELLERRPLQSAPEVLVRRADPLLPHHLAAVLQDHVESGVHRDRLGSG